MDDNKLKIILADDDADDMEILYNIFTAHPSFTVVAKMQSGPEIMEYLEHNSYPDIILTDMYMPRMTGIEVTEKIIENKAENDLRIIIFSTTINESDEAKFREFGMIDFYEKPNTLPMYRSLPDKILSGMQKDLPG